MFSLIVTSSPTAWETDQLMRMPADRFKEYSDGSDAKAVHRTKPETLSLLNGTPALLMYEDGSGAEHKDTVRYGLLRDVKLAGADLTFRFEQEGCFPRKVVQEFGDRLDIHQFEYNRTHWAMKDGAILSAMLANSSGPTTSSSPLPARTANTSRQSPSTCGPKVSRYSTTPSSRRACGGRTWPSTSTQFTSAPASTA